MANAVVFVIERMISIITAYWNGKVAQAQIVTCLDAQLPNPAGQLRDNNTLDTPNVTNEASDVIFVKIFPWKCQKKLDTQMSRMKHPMSFLYGFFHEIVKKKLDTQMSGIKDPMSLLYGFFCENVKEMSRMKPPHRQNQKRNIVLS